MEWRQPPTPTPTSEASASQRNDKPAPSSFPATLHTPVISSRSLADGAQGIFLHCGGWGASTVNSPDLSGEKGPRLPSWGSQVPGHPLWGSASSLNVLCSFISFIGLRPPA